MVAEQQVNDDLPDSLLTGVVGSRLELEQVEDLATGSEATNYHRQDILE